jgi:SAM-dependent methyltransferase/uncharacterized protein YbaR (Trm112 family)
MDDKLLSRLRCPVDHGALRRDGDALGCAGGHTFPVVQGVPVLLVDDPDPTLWVTRASLAAARSAHERPAGDLFIDTLGVTDEQRAKILTLPPGPVDPVVAMVIPGTCGLLYVHRQGAYTSYPIPDLRLPQAHGELFLEIGCNWGRWCVAAARKGYEVVGIDPSLAAVLAAQRVAKQLGVEARFVVADARRLPFAPRTFDVVFSYSVIQHFRRDNAEVAVEEVGKVLRPGGVSFIQMPNRIGARSLYHQARRGFAEPPPATFDVRYWWLSELERLFERAVGPTKIQVDGFFGLGIQSTDVEHMKPLHRLVCHASDLLRKASEAVPALVQVADSVYARSIAR